MSSIQVIDRLVLLLETIAAYEEPVTLKVLAAETALHTSTAFRILASAQDHGLVERDGSGAYRLGVKLLQLGGRVRTRLDLIREARPVMERLRDQVGETVNLTVREGDEVVYVERVTAQRMMRVEQVIGSRAPLHVTAVGKMMLGAEGEAALTAYASRTGLPAFTANTLTDVATLSDVARSAYLEGFAYDNEEAEVGVGCIGVLIRDSAGEVVAGLSISAPMERRRDEWVPLLQAAGRRIAARLGHYESVAPADEP
jgi:DNA-binding IclR family transcriptional regulator